MDGMEMESCRGPSPAAWNILHWLASDFIAVSDSIAIEGMWALANDQAVNDVPIVCGEFSVAAMGVMLNGSLSPEFRERLGLDATGQGLLFGLEGATDPSMYEKLVGMSPDEVFDAQARHVELVSRH